MAMREETFKEPLKNSLPAIFQLAAARVTPTPRSINQRLTPLIDAGVSCPGREPVNKSSVP